MKLINKCLALKQFMLNTIQMAIFIISFQSSNLSEINSNRIIEKFEIENTT